jgi:UDP:flavonoid glycosyltransferase YjiC (YdhE family)
MDINSENVEEVFPEREKIKSQISKLRFDLVNAFILRGPEYYADILGIYQEFPFDIMVADCTFTGIPFVSDIMDIPVISIGVMPLIESSRDLAPPGLGMTPSYTTLGKIKQRMLRYISNQVLFRKPNKVMHQVLEKFGIEHHGLSVFDVMARKATLILQSGTPGFEYYRSDLGQNVRFIGALLPYSSGKKQAPWFNNKLNHYDKIVLVTQGTVEKNPEKIIVPTLEALKDSDTLVIATTGGSGTAELRKRFPQQNLIIEDFIPFADIMPYADAYITNGGYGGVMLGIEHELPLIVAGVHEGKNEINARIGYFKLGINLKTENPSPSQIKRSVEEVTFNKLYKGNIQRLAREFRGYNPNELCAYYIRKIFQRSGKIYFSNQQQEEKIY